MAFKKMEDQGILPGPRALLVCGYKEDEHLYMESYLKESGIENIQLVPCRFDSLGMKVGEVLSEKSKGDIVAGDKLPPVMVWAGISHEELDSALRDFQKTGLKRPIFATATPSNMNFTVKELLNHLMSEQRSMREAMNQSE